MTLVVTNFSNMNNYELFYKLLQNTTDVITIYDSSDYYKSRQRVVTIYDRYVITNHDNYYYNLRQVLQFTTTVITIHDRYYNSRRHYNSRQYTPLVHGKVVAYERWSLTVTIKEISAQNCIHQLIT